MTTGDDMPGWLADCRPVEVDISTLAQFAKALRDEVESNFVPHMQLVIETLDPGRKALPAGEGFGELAATRGRYEDCRNRAIDLMDAYARVTREIADAADAVAQQYRGSDVFAAARADQVRGAFTAAARVNGVADV
jgi:hypothetical protein